MFPLGMWVERVLDAMTTHDARHPDHIDAIAWLRMRRTWFQELLSAEPGLVTAFCHSRANEGLIVLFDGWGRDQAERGWWPDPGNGPARVAELRWRGRVRRRLRSLRPYPCAAQTSSRSCRTRSWTRWRTPDRRAGSRGSCRTSWRPGRGTSRAGTRCSPHWTSRPPVMPGCSPWPRPCSPHRGSTWPWSQTARCSPRSSRKTRSRPRRGRPGRSPAGRGRRHVAVAVSAHVAASLDALTADQVAVFVTLAPDWPGTWGELLRAAELTTAS